MKMEAASFLNPKSARINRFPARKRIAKAACIWYYKRYQMWLFNMERNQPNHAGNERTETNMKKLLALLMALMMCCTAFAFAEEEAEVPAVEMNVSFEAQTVALGENAENILLFAVNADQTVSITAQLSAMSFETLLQGIQDAGATEEMLAELYVNENYCLMYTPGDTVLALYAFLDDETVLAVTFQVASKEVGDALENMPLEIFGSLAAAE